MRRQYKGFAIRALQILPMESLTLTAKNPFDLAALAEKLDLKWYLPETIPGQIAVVEDDRTVYLILDDKEPQKTRLYIQYGNVGLVKRVFLEIADCPDYYVDNDFRTECPANEFAARIRNEPNWDWRKDLPQRRQ